MQARVEQAEDVADVAGVLEWRPAVGTRPLAHAVAGEHRRPGDGVGVEEAGDVVVAERGRVEPALRARPLEHPGPVLGVGLDGVVVAHRGDGRCRGGRTDEFAPATRSSRTGGHHLVRTVRLVPSGRVV